MTRPYRPGRSCGSSMRSLPSRSTSARASCCDMNSRVALLMTLRCAHAQRDGRYYGIDLLGRDRSNLTTEPMQRDGFGLKRVGAGVLTQSIARVSSDRDEPWIRG